jgi:hypothetical protein
MMMMMMMMMTTTTTMMIKVKVKNQISHYVISPPRKEPVVPFGQEGMMMMMMMMMMTTTTTTTMMIKVKVKNQTSHYVISRYPLVHIFACLFPIAATGGVCDAAALMRCRTATSIDSSLPCQ